VLLLGLEQRAPLDGGLEGGEGVARRAVQVRVLVDELEHECALGMRRAHLLRVGVGVGVRVGVKVRVGVGVRLDGARTGESSRA
jgi:hypothetical protein